MKNVVSCLGFDRYDLILYREDVLDIGHGFVKDNLGYDQGESKVVKQDPGGAGWLGYVVLLCCGLVYSF